MSTAMYQTKQTDIRRIFEPPPFYARFNHFLETKDEPHLQNT